MIDQIGHIILAISKEQVFQKDVSMFKTIIENTCIPQIRLADHPLVCSPVELFISGYDNDTRELWDIPEAVEWYKTLYKNYPYVPYFLSPRSTQLYFGILEIVATDLVPEAKQMRGKELAALILDTFAHANIFFNEVFGSDLARYQPKIDILTKKIIQAAKDLVQGKWGGD